MYKAAPRKVKATIIEGLVMQHGLTFKDLEEGLGVTRWQWDNVQSAILQFASGKKDKAARGVAMKVDEATVEKFVDFYLRPDNTQDVAYGARAVKLDDGTSFICPHWTQRITEPKWPVLSSRNSVRVLIKCLPGPGCTK